MVMGTILKALMLVLTAGFINGSFAAPMKYMNRWSEENVWFVFSFFGFLILPWLTLFIMVPDVFDIIRTIPTGLLLIIILGGIGFGIGQIAFALSFQCIGIGLAFVINISMGTSGSALIPILWHKGVMGTAYSYLQIIGIMLFILAVIFGAYAGIERDKNKGRSNEKSDPKIRKIRPGLFMMGILLAVFAGAGSVSQGVTYIWSNPAVSELAVNSFGSDKIGSAIITWVIIFSSAWIPYAVYFFVLSLKRRTCANIFRGPVLSYWFLTVLMGCGFWGSLILFSTASNEIGGNLAPTIAWPLFMAFIILTSYFWSWRSDEWKNAGEKAYHKMFASIFIFVMAIIVFSCSSSLQPRNPKTPNDKYHNIHYQHIKHDNYPVYKLGR
ncbi:MAG: L-rhamnose/proton symporter RhaT [Candidatus Margulisiibacteriota bacterium]